jgi:MFS family permease
MPKLLADVTPLKHSRDFRLLFIGQLISFLGSQLTVVAVPVQVFRLTGSSFTVGLVSLGQMVPLILGSLIGGAVADAHDRRKLLMVMQVLLALTSAGLALNAMRSAPALWPLFVVTGVAAFFAGFDGPARTAALPAVVATEELPAAFALRQLQIQVGVVVGPAIAGILLARASVSAVYWIDVATFGGALVAVSMLRPLPPEGGGTRASLASIAEGLRYLRRHRLILSTFVIDVNAMVFGMPRALFPAVGLRVLHGTNATVGLLFAAPGAGALLVAVFTGWVGQVRRHGLAVIIAVMLWGAGIAGFGLVRVLWAAVVCLAVAGAADVVSAVFRSTITQTLVPDALRGRVSAVNLAVVTGGPRLGDLEAGGVAALAGTQFSIVSGGLACIAGALGVAWLFPELGRYDARGTTELATAGGEAAEPSA